MTSYVLANILAPLSMRAFLDAYWRQKCLHITNRANFYQDLFSWTDLNTVLATQRLTYPRVRLVEKGITLTHEETFYESRDRRNRPVSRLNSIVVHQCLRRGGLLVFDCIEETTINLQLLAASIETVFDEYCQINGYFQTSAGWGFERHHDPHDVFVMQLHGEKTWSVFNRNDVEKKFRLVGGDILYIPKGWDHMAVPGATGSAHLTIGVEYPCRDEKSDDLSSRYDSIIPTSFQESVCNSRPLAHSKIEKEFWSARRSKQWSRQLPQVTQVPPRIFSEEDLFSLVTRFQFSELILNNLRVAEEYSVELILELLEFIVIHGPISLRKLELRFQEILRTDIERQLRICEWAGLIVVLNRNTLPQILCRQF
jgi:hypothetical protein